MPCCAKVAGTSGWIEQSSRSWTVAVNNPLKHRRAASDHVPSSLEANQVATMNRHLGNTCLFVWSFHVAFQPSSVSPRIPSSAGSVDMDQQCRRMGDSMVRISSTLGSSRLRALTSTLRLCVLRVSFLTLLRRESRGKPYLEGSTILFSLTGKLSSCWG